MNQAERAPLPHRETSPRTVINDVYLRDGHEASRVRRGTVVHAVPGSAYEQELGGAANLRPVEAHHEQALRSAGTTN